VVFSLGKPLNGKNMKTGQKTLILFVASAAVALTGRAVDQLPAGDSLSSDNPYSGIINRNIFDLHEATRTQEAPQPEPASPKVKLAGITTILGDKQALLTVNAPGAAGKPPTTYSLILGEHERFGGLEVLEINPQAKTVKIKSDEIESLIHLGSAEARK
jgi:hypothetical protein